ncbi:MAG: SDR family NAD(P)-dependent oxidoreductase [Bacteroidales bacterium]
MYKLKEKLNQKIAKLQGDPKQIARSFALGSFMGVTPFVGMQILISVSLAFLLRMSKTAVIAGVLNTNWTKGLLLYPLNYKIGCFILGIPATVNINQLFQDNFFQNLLNSGYNVFIALLAGGCITGSVLAIFYYYLVIKLLKTVKATQKNDSPEPQSNPGNYALITGASQGLGRAIALELASRNINVLLVALKDEGLPELCKEIRRNYKVDAQFYEADFKERNSVYEVAGWAMNYQKVFMLINNAGLGGSCAFDQASPEYLDSIIQVNVRATSMLTRLLLPELRNNEKAYILNVASMASFSPFAFKTVYPASKAFVYSFSRGLHEELKGSNVFVSVIHPGPIKTNPEVTARIEKQGFFGKMGLVSVERLAQISVTQLFKRDSLILPGLLNKLNWVMMILLPNAWKLPLLSRVVKREISSKPTFNHAA